MSLANAPTPLSTVLIANRGEIACRVIRTARRLGLKSVAVYSDADAMAYHVREADEALRLGPAPARESYLNVKAVIEAAKRSGASAIHPGYGFLSENAEFVAACEQAGIVFIGPPASAIAAMGDKSAAKARMDAAGVPLVPGYHGDDQDEATLKTEADQIGYPVLLKASAGGGGKGMRIVERGEDFQAALEGCRRESQAAFNDQRMLIEKYLTQPRHVEVQVFCDSHGDGVYLFERDCSVQRRHQKVLEEAPAPGMTQELRRQMGDAAVRAAKEIGYVGAGTVEFLLNADNSFYFMEMNTRLQVEHPVTEMITGEDLVEWQLRVAAGLPLPKRQEELTITGHAFEARLYAEDPEQDFLPATGHLERFELDMAGANLDPSRVRLDSGVEAGDEITMYYDPMLAKLITHGDDRDQALATLNRALSALDVSGVTTNRAFLQRLASHADFRKAELTTRFIELHEAELFSKATLDNEAYASAALFALDLLQRESHKDSPWARRDGWRLNAPARIRIALTDPAHAGDDADSSAILTVLAERQGKSAWRLQVNDHILEGQLQRLEGDGVAILLDGHRRRWLARRDRTPHGDVLVLGDAEQETRLFWRRLDAVDHGHHEVDATLTAPMHGTVVTLLIEPGERVEKGTPLMVMEAMKMEHTLNAPADGVVEAFHFAAGDTVGQGDELLTFNADE
ncbi:acetyl/propionyl/methylcrotonyl-CoA carboxylase subunit alpha [Halomonas sp. PR-M31]|uniref:acetyl/propionyl/methylcrotonyl-CoA carboxylase subunit alpha n=1 Tax=Halomonas sp. PR-M31 TaxID=1471202 RepID=UPI000651B4ED|nr:acetyl/propionyl/methylcrotonyl-CoA carboxylase subunit alpha [Halomonas sp. PR-M31]